MSRPAVNDSMLKIPALGRDARLGFLYDERTDQFMDVYIFKGPISDFSVTTSQTPDTSLETSLTNSYREKFNLFKVEASLAANFLSGMLNVEGCAQFLMDDKKSSREVNGMMLLSCQTVVENLQIYYDVLKHSYNTDVLHYNGATHIVTGITWGANVAIKFTDFFDNKNSQQNIEGELKVEFEKVKSFKISASAKLSMKDTDKDEKSKFELSVRGDILLPDKVPTTYQQVQELISKVPELIRTTNNGKGVPVQFSLTPLSLLRDHLKLITQQNNLSKQLDGSLLSDFIGIFDEISHVETSINDKIKQLSAHPICVAPETRINALDLRAKFLKCKTRFTTAMRETLVGVRSGTVPEKLLSDLAEGYIADSYGAYEVPKILYEFDSALNKVDYYQTVSASFKDVQYFGRQTNLESGLLRHINDVVYILFMKQGKDKGGKMSEDTVKAWNENSNLFFRTLNKPFNKLFLVDCDFDFLQANHLSRTVLKQIVNGVITIDDVQKVMKSFIPTKPHTMKALGRCGKVGELYDMRTERFLDENILASNHPDSLIRVTSDDITETHSISSESYAEKFKALDVESELQFSILADLVPLARCGAYLSKPVNSITSTSGVRIQSQSFIHTRRLGSEEIQVQDPNLWKVLAIHKVDKGATHFVTRIEHGINSIFSVSTLCNDDDSDESADTKLEKLRSYVQKLQDIISHIEIPKIDNEPKNRYATSSNNSGKDPTISSSDLGTLKIEPGFEIRIYSDIQAMESKPEIITSNEGLLHFVNKKFIPQQREKNSGRGVPISYVLYPLSNLANEVGVLSKPVSYGTLSMSMIGDSDDLGQNQGQGQDSGQGHGFIDPSEYARILHEIEMAREQINQMEVKLKTNLNCVTDQDFLTLDKIKMNFSTTLGSYPGKFKNIICAVKRGKIGVDAFKGLLAEYQSQLFFDTGLQYIELEKLRSVDEQIVFCEQLQGKGIGYLGRENSALSFNSIFTEDVVETVYLLHYHPEWIQKEGDLWRQTCSFFLGELANCNTQTNQAQCNGEKENVDAEAENWSQKITQKLYVVNWDFPHPQCYGGGAELTKPAIHEYTRGQLTSTNVIDTRREREDTLLTKILNLEKNLNDNAEETQNTQLKIANLKDAMDIKPVHKHHVEREKRLKDLRWIRDLLQASKDDTNVDVEIRQDQGQDLNTDEESLENWLERFKKVEDVIEEGDTIRSYEADQDEFDSLVDAPELETFSKALFDKQQYKECLRVWEIIHERKALTLEPDQLDSINLQFNIAQSLYFLEDYQKALDLFRIVYDTSLRVKDPGDESSALNVTNVKGYVVRTLEKLRQGSQPSEPAPLQSIQFPVKPWTLGRVVEAMKHKKLEGEQTIVKTD